MGNTVPEVDPSNFSGCACVPRALLRVGTAFSLLLRDLVRNFPSTPRLYEPTGSLGAEPGNLQQPERLKMKPPPGHLWGSRPATHPISAPLFSLMPFPSVGLIGGMQNDMGTHWVRALRETEYQNHTSGSAGRAAA